MSPTWDGNYQASAAERRDLLDHFQHNVTGKVLLCTGDRHAAAVGEWGNVVEMLAGPVSSIGHTLPNFSNAIWADADLTTKSVDKVAGVVDVDLAGGYVTLRWVRSDAVETHRFVITL
jgi:hypothetical protein